MKHQALGVGGPRVSVIGLGAMPLSLANRPPREDALRVVRRAVAMGVTLIDTADVYCIDDNDLGHNEALIAQALASIPGARERVLIATKGGLRRPRGAWTSSASPDALRRACEASLRALATDCIALYQLHAPDAKVPLADSVGALARLREEGKIERVGLSNVDVEQIEIARAIVPITSVQNRYNLFERGADKRGVIAHCQRHGIAFLPHSPVGGHREHSRVLEDATLTSLAARHTATPYEIAIAWLLAQGEGIFPIPGASRVSSIESSIRAAALVLTREDLEALDQAFPRRTRFA